jgi:PAS domain S-box-containing protein
LLSNTMVDRMPYMVWTYDERGALDYVNASWTAYTGLTFEESARASSWNHLLDPEDNNGFIKALDRSIMNGIPFAREAKMKHCDRADGHRWHAIRVDPAVDSNGKITAWTGTAVDVEDRKQAEITLLERELQYQRERARSTLFQRAALPPHLPTVAGLTFDAVYEPGLSDEQVGGDWYDAVRLIDGRVLLAIGDVSGSGLNAAVIMGVVRQIMRGIAQLHAEPALMLDAADRALRLEYPDTLVTAWVGIFDLVGRTLTYASAGHPSALLIDAHGRVRELNHMTLPIGLRQGHQGQASTIPIGDDSALWLYTDGLIEATHDILEGTRRLREAALELGTEAVVHPASMIRRFVIPSGSPDDVAILVVRTNFSESERYLTRWHFASNDPHAAAAARHAFTAALPKSKFSDADIANAEMVFVELVGNVARHAPGPVDVVMDSSGMQNVLHVLDRGPGFQHFSRLPRDPLAEKGRGLFIIETLTTEFTVSQRVGGGSDARAVLVGRFPMSLLRDQTQPAVVDQVAQAM